MTGKYLNYTNQDIINKSKEVVSICGLLKALDLRPAGGNYINIKRKLQALNVDTSHWTGQAWSKNKQLKDFVNYTRPINLKKHVTKTRSHACETCGISEWVGRPLVLEMDHIDGDRTNNNYDNLKLLCPNCHSQTSTWRNKKRIVKIQDITPP